MQSKDTFRIFENQIKNNEIVLYMKGTKNSPLCGFSNLVIQILQNLNVKNFLCVDVLSDPQIKEDIKEYTKWPTIPQLYIRGNFIGGSDIVKDMYESGELKKLIDN